MAILYSGGYVFTPTSGGQDLTFSRVLALTCKDMKLSFTRDLSANSILMDYPVNAAHP